MGYWLDEGEEGRGPGNGLKFLSSGYIYHNRLFFIMNVCTFSLGVAGPCFPNGGACLYDILRIFTLGTSKTG